MRAIVRAFDRSWKPRQPATPVRLTRRGRVVLLLFLLLVGGVCVVLASPASQASTPPGPAPIAVVEPGDTLWSVAARTRPGQDPFTTIEQIRRLNSLDDYTIHAGQHLILPRQR